MTALTFGDVEGYGDARARAGAPRLRVVREGDLKRYGPAVRPDRPNTRGNTLHAVPTAASADEAALAVRWSKEPVRRSGAPARRSRQPRMEQRRMRASQARTYSPELNFDNAVKVTLTLAGMVLVFALGIFLYTALGFGLQAGDAITVVAGDSLWSIAQAMPVDIPTAQIVQDIAELNALESSVVAAGTELILPAY